MRALIWKEWRQHAKWVIVPGLLILVPMGLMGVPSLMDVQYLAYVGLVNALFGAMLGFLQVFPEAHGDKRAILLHRPLSRSRIFVAKALAGVGLYLLGVGLPFAWVIVLAATPGHVDEPFTWGMTLPWLADCLTGIVCYFAGMLTAQREGRWYGSRCLGLAEGYTSWLAAWMLPQFSEAAATILVLGVIVAVAAWGNFLTGGVYANQPRLAKLALASTFLFGLLSLSLTAKFWIGAWFLHKSDSEYVLDRHGQVLTAHHQDGVLQSVTTLAGQTPPEIQGKRLDRYQLEQITVPSARGGIAPIRSYRNKNQFIIECDNATRPGSEKWWYVPALGRLLGYDKHSHLRIGSLGPDGFAPPEQSGGEQFHGKLAHNSIFFYSKAGPYLAFPDAVYAVDYRAQKITKLFTPATSEKVLWASRWQNDKDKSVCAFVCTDRAIHVLKESGAPIVSTPRLYDLETYRIAAEGRLSNPERYWVRYEPAWYLSLPQLETMPGAVTIFDRAGRPVLPHQQLPPRPGGADLPIFEPSNVQVAFAPFTGPAEAAALLGTERGLEAGMRANGGKETPIILPVLYAVTQPWLVGVRWDLSARSGLALAYGGLMLSVALVCGVACCMLGRRCGLSKAHSASWGVVGVAFGWVSVIVMLAVQEWPSRVRCPSCHKSRIVTREECEHCGAPHAAPAVDGTEVFEDGVAIAESLPTVRSC